MLPLDQASFISGKRSCRFPTMRLTVAMSGAPNGTCSVTCWSGNLAASKICDTMPASDTEVRSASLSAPSFATVPPYALVHSILTGDPAAAISRSSVPMNVSSRTLTQLKTGGWPQVMVNFSTCCACAAVQAGNGRKPGGSRRTDEMPAIHVFPALSCFVARTLSDDVCQDQALEFVWPELAWRAERPIQSSRVPGHSRVRGASHTDDRQRLPGFRRERGRLAVTSAPFVGSPCRLPCRLACSVIGVGFLAIVSYRWSRTRSFRGKAACQ